MKCFKCFECFNEKGSRKSYFAAYTLAMVSVFSIIFFIFLAKHKSFVWSTDGLIQHYTSLAYWGHYLRGIIEGVLFEHKLEIPMWDLHIGYGADILTTLHYYVIGDPLNLLSVFVPERYTEYLFDFLIFVRIYLAGAAFSLYCLYHKNKRLPVLMGSIIYAYSQWIIVAGLNHPYFINPCIYLPLILLGIDMIFDGKKPYTYIFSIALAGISNFYFFYMLGIFAVIYAVFRYIVKFGKIRPKELGGWLGKFSIYSVTGILISGVVLVPVLMTVLGSGRMETERYTPILYGGEFYRTLLAAFAGKNIARYSYIGVAFVCVLSLLILFMQKKKYTALKIGFLLIIIMVCVPCLGRMMNGFSYVSNRWSWASSMLFAYIFVKMYPEFFRLSVRQRAAAGVLAGVYAGYLIFDPVVKGTHNRTAGVLLLVFVLAAVLGHRFWQKRPDVWAGVLALCIFVSVGVNIYFFYVGEPEEEGRVCGHVDAGTCYDRSHTDVNLALSQLEGIKDTRYEQNSTTLLSNSAMLNGVNSGRFYYSIAPDGVGEFFEDMHMQNYIEQNIINLNSRTWLLKLFSTGYYVGSGRNIPYGFKPVDNAPKIPEELVICRDEDALPFAYTYDKAVSVDAFEKMNAAQRQEAMMEGAVLEESSLPEAELVFHSKEVPFTVVKTDGITVEEDGTYKVEKGGASCTLSLHGASNCETYLTFTGFHYDGLHEGEKTLTDPDDITTAYVTVAAKGSERGSKQQFRVLSVKNNFQCGRENFGVNMGYRKEPVKKIQVVFEQPGTYELGAMKVLCQKTDMLDELTRARKEDAPEDLVIRGNHIKCSVDFDKTRELVFSIPFSKGWTLYVDGEKQEAHRVNRMFIGGEIPAGKHQVEMVYRTPYLFVGLACSVAGLAMVIGMVLEERRKNRNGAA